MGGITGQFRSAGRLLGGVTALCALATLLGACVADQTGAVVQPAVVRVPAEAPRTTGRERVADSDHLKLVASFGGEARAPNVTRMLTEVTDRLVKASDRPDQAYAVTLLDSPVVNAFALPNGRLYVTRGLVALANDTSEVAAVLAHEMAHVTLNHATARSELELRSALVSRVVADVLNDPDTGAQLQHQSRFALARFSREQELEADATGVRTLAKAGYDPFAAGRFLTALNRSTGLKAGSAAAPDMLATHPGTAERIVQVTRAARRIGAPGIGTDDRATFLAAVDGLAYGDNPRDGAVRGHRFIHPGLGIAFEVPEGFALENTRSAVLGTTQDGSRRLLFDQIDAKEGQSLEAVLKASWNDAFDPAGFETREVAGHPAAFALSRGKEWTFRLAAIRIGDSTYRMIMAAKGAADPDPAFRRWTATLAAVPSDEVVLRPLRLQVVQATSTGAEDLARRMAVPDRALDRFLVLNGLERGAPLVAGRSYKIVTE
ncbi:M48 family metalloprotease [Methylobacterium mesophilicum SR1.6/6]|uniref:M48 family metalloprotease n=1 Tax=Methylobacterium mesophilicum SR1.6/6 TaxID=908290 RepID=A0A6B9FLP7_9HYPH|nr:M48 family metalloprotease [Methylobacterium mesophilicum]QGY02084.1 M48 family metalloprotease [Methylobacterium mesophilicum SR1.6/6]